MKNPLSNTILTALILSMLTFTANPSKAQLTLDCESGNRDVEIANCWGFGATSYSSDINLVISGLWSTRSNQLTNPSPTASWIKTPWFKPAPGNITFKVRLSAANGTTRGVALTYIVYDPSKLSKEGDTLLFETIYLPTPFNTNIHNLSVAMPAEIADSDEIYKIRVSFIGTGGNSRLIGDDFVFPGLYWSNPAAGCISLPLPNAWTGTIDRQWELDGNWSRNHTPLPHHNVSIPPVPNQPIINSEVLINSLVIENGSKVTIAYNGKLKVTGSFVNNNGPEGLFVKSNPYGTGSLIYNAPDVYGTIETYIPAAGYHLVSVPISQASNPLSGLFLWSYLFDYDIPGQKWVGLGSPTATPLFSDKGYMIYKYSTPPWQPDTIYNFAGLLNNGPFSCHVDYPNFLGNHCLVPNPYPSAIDWNAESGWTKTNIGGSFWMWIHSANNYGVWNGSTGTHGVSKDIPVGQSFFVQATGSNPELIINNNARLHSMQSFYKDELDNENQINLEAWANNYVDEVIVLFNDNCTPGYDDMLDAEKMFGGEQAPQLFFMLDEGKKLSINALPFTGGFQEIAIGFSMDIALTVTLSVSELNLFNPQVPVHLLDLVTGTIIDLRTNPTYSFSHDPDNDPLRFKLLFNNTVSVKEIFTHNISAWFQNDYLNLVLPQNLEGIPNMKIYDAAGKLILSTPVNAGKSLHQIPGIIRGVYFVQVVGTNNNFVRKVVF